ncbi:MAG: YidH family protein [Candidatus Acidiferrales bacterium]
MPQTTTNDSQPLTKSNPNLARDHLANERTFLAWVRTGVADVVFGIAIGRFAIAIRQQMQIQGRVAPSTGISVWFGTAAMLAGVLVCPAGLVRYRRTREQIDSGNFQPAGFLIELVGIVTALFGLTLAGYLVYTELHF